MTLSLERVAIAGESIDAFRENDRVWIVARRVCDVLNINADAQRVKLTQKPWARTAMIAVPDGAGRARETFCVDLDTLPSWLAGIEPGRVDANVAMKLVQFQVEARDVLARHFFGSGSTTAMNAVVGSGGSATSGRAPTAAAPTSGSALQMLQMFDALSGAVRASIGEIAEVRALVDTNRAELEAELVKARAATAEAVAVADRAVANSTFAREDRRRCDAAVRVITKATQTFSACRGDSYQVNNSRLRRELGLKSTANGGKPLGKAGLSASQVLVLADAATRMGVPGVGSARISAILNGVDVVPPPAPPTRIAPRADDIDVIDGMVAVAARSNERRPS